MSAGITAHERLRHAVCALGLSGAFVKVPQPRTAERLAIYGLAYDLPMILRHPPTEPWAAPPPWHPAQRLRALLGAC